MSTLQSFFCTRIFRILFSMILAVSFTPLNGQQVRATSDIEVMELIKDIRPGVESSQIWDVTPSGEHIFFTADDGVNGSELWVSDGTSTGTHLVKDLNPGSGGTTFEFMTPFFGQLLFFAITPADNEQLWISDGTSDGTHIVKKFYPGIASRWQPVVFNNRMIFYDNRQLWVTDGTEAGTLLLLDVSSGINTGLNSLIAGQNQAFFVGWEPTKFYLGITDGTPEGTSRLVDPYDIPSFPYFFSIDNTLYFYEKTTPSQVQLFKMELNSRTKTLLHTFEDGKYEYKLKSFTQADGNTFYFLAILDVKYPDTNFKTELWVSDGTQAGTKQVINLPSADAIKELFWQSPYLYFSSFSWDISPSIARTDGTSTLSIML